MTFGSRHRTSAETIGAVFVDGDSCCVLVCEDAGGDRPARVVFHAECPTTSLEATVGSAGIRTPDAWTVALSGAEVLHEIVAVPLQVRSFPEARLEACLAGSNWGNLEAVHVSGYRLAHAFDDEACVIGVARAEAVARSFERLGPATRVTSAAYALASLVRRVDPAASDPNASCTLAILCSSTSIASAVLESGRIRHLGQTDLLEYLCEAVAFAAPAPVADEPLEFELAGAYSAPPPSRRTRKIDVADVEAEVYQSCVMRIIEELLALYREQYVATTSFPERILLTGDAVTRHALHGYLSRYLGAQFAIDELDAALAVTADDAATARDLAAGQNTFGGALALVAKACDDDALEFTLGNEPEIAAARRARPRLGIAQTVRRLLPAVAVACLTTGVVAGGRFAAVSSENATLSEQLRVEQERAERLDGIAAERRRVESRLAHTRELLGALTTLRAQQTLPVDVVARVERGLPTGTRLDEIAYSNGTVRVAGSSLDREDPVRLALALEGMQDAFADVQPATETTTARVYDEALGEEVDQTRYAFTISARYIAAPPAADAERALNGQPPVKPTSAALKGGTRP